MPPCALRWHSASGHNAPLMLTARDLTLRRGPEPLFEQVEFSVFRGDKAQQGAAR
jgi:hypothetical protein